MQLNRDPSRISAMHPLPMGVLGGSKGGQKVSRQFGPAVIKHSRLHSVGFGANTFVGPFPCLRVSAIRSMDSNRSAQVGWEDEESLVDAFCHLNRHSAKQVLGYTRIKTPFVDPDKSEQISFTLLVAIELLGRRFNQEVDQLTGPLPAQDSCRDAQDKSHRLLGPQITHVAAIGMGHFMPQHDS